MSVNAFTVISFIGKKCEIKHFPPKLKRVEMRRCIIDLIISKNIASKDK